MDNRQYKMTAALVCGLLGCFCFGAGDWLMIYGDTAHVGSIFWLTVGTAAIAPGRNALAMDLHFPGVPHPAVVKFMWSKKFPAPNR